MYFSRVVPLTYTFAYLVTAAPLGILLLSPARSRGDEEVMAAMENTLPQLSSMMVLALLCLRGSLLVRGTECLMGCMLMAMHPFDEDGLITWEARGACHY